MHLFIFKKVLFIYLFFREEEREVEREGEKHQCVVVSWRAPHWGLSQHPRHVP